MAGSARISERLAKRPHRYLIALGSNILLMVLILLWRPRGLYPVGK